MCKPLITIITAAWRVDGLKRVVACLNNQIFKNFEHLIINDNNPEVREFLKENNYFETDKHRHVIDSHTRFHYYGGICRNIGILVAFSYIREQERNEDKEFICFFDDDNLWESNHLQSMITALENNPNASMIATDAIWVGANNKTWREQRKCAIKHGACDLGQFLYKTKLFHDYGYFFPHPRHKQKYDFELISKMSVGEGDKLVYTHLPTFIMNYKKK